MTKAYFITVDGERKGERALYSYMNDPNKSFIQRKVQQYLHDFTPSERKIRGFVNPRVSLLEISKLPNLKKVPMGY